MDSHHHKSDEHQAPLLNDTRDSAEEDIELARLDGSLELDSAPETHLVHDDDAPHVVTVKRNAKSYLAIAGALATTVLGFTVNTEATAYIEDILGWKKPFMTMYITHSALALPWLCSLVYSRYVQHRHLGYRAWVRDYNNQLRELITTVDAYATTGPYLIYKRKGNVGGPLDFLATTMAIVTVVLTVSGCSWFLSLVLTTPADLTAIYNCSTFFAAAFSVPILKEKLGWISITAVALSIAGTFVIAYGDTTAEHAESEIGTSRLLGNLIACIGAVAFGLYEVLFKKWASSSRSMEPAASLPLTFAGSALTGIYTFCTVWILLVILHFTGVEPIVIPSWRVVGWLILAVLAGSIAIQLLVVLVVWTDPVFGSMANVLSVFAVAVADWFVFGLAPSLATYIGGALIIVAFAMLTKDTLGSGGHGKG